jgi:hypothetical protein
MRAYEILLEYSREKTAQNSGNKLIDAMMRDPGMSDLLVDKSPSELEQIKQLLQTSSDIQQDLLSQFESADPTKNKQYTQWIIGRYIKRDFLIEDLEVVHRYLEKFIEAIRQKLVQNRDLNSYTLGSLKKLIREIYSGKTDSDDKDDALYPIIPGTQVLYNGPLGQFVIPKTLAASQALQKVGHEAEWCTADSRAPTHYPEYAEQGPLYVWIDADGSKYQFHFPTSQFMDEWDNELEEDKMIEFFKNNHITAPVLFRELTERVKNDGEILVYLPYELCTRELCRIAVAGHGEALGYVPEEFITPELCKLAVSIKGSALGSVPEQFITPKLCKLAVSGDGYALQYVPEQLRTPELCKIAVSGDGYALQYVPEQLRTPELCKIAVSGSGHALRSVPVKLCTPELCKIAVSRNGYALQYVPEQLRTPELCRLAVEKDGSALQYVPEQFITPKLCKLAVSGDGYALQYVPDHLKQQIKRELGIT